MAKAQANQKNILQNKLTKLILKYNLKHKDIIHT
jgi:hypothetical protein